MFVANNGVNRSHHSHQWSDQVARLRDCRSGACDTIRELDLYLNIALDGYGETHDRIRGVPGNWEKTLDCIESLYPLKGEIHAIVFVST